PALREVKLLEKFMARTASPRQHRRTVAQQLSCRVPTFCRGRGIPAPIPRDPSRQDAAPTAWNPDKQSRQMSCRATVLPTGFSPQRGLRMVCAGFQPCAGAV
ncbi:MAG: hypothetical protein KC940_12920, partial [Candidatus Omnitrophica bacterium]|nr:hypothetical protein [Candidatus Omnitrophota bacterium]